MNQVGDREIIFFIDDRPYNQGYKDSIQRVADVALKGTGIKLNTANSLKELHKYLLKARNNVAGFILPLVLNPQTLQDMDMQGVPTDKGMTTGARIAVEAIFNANNLSPYGDTFKELQVLLYSIEKDAEKNNGYMEKANNYFENLMVINKKDEYGKIDTSMKEISEWIRNLKI